MITGKYLENPALYSPDELERLDNHIEKYFGKATTVVHEFFSEDIHVDVSIIPPHEEHNYYTLVTTGMGAFSMKIPSEYQEDGLPSRIELMMCLPPEWNPESKESQENWPVELLRYLARFPIIESTWLGYGAFYSKRNTIRRQYIAGRVCSFRRTGCAGGCCRL